MSLKTWKSEFYPKKPSSKMSTRQAIEHSLQKWIGLRKENRRKHDISTINDHGALFDGREQLYIDVNSCALCSKFFRLPPLDFEFMDGDEISSGIGCPDCPLQLTLRKVCDFDDNSPYVVWRNFGNPEPMIKALEETLRRYKDDK